MANTVHTIEVLHSNEDVAWAYREEQLDALRLSATTSWVVFIDAGEVKTSDPEHVQNATRQRHHMLRDTFGMPADFWSSMLQDASGFFRAIEQRNSKGELQSRETWLRLLVKHVTRKEPERVHDKHSENVTAKIEYIWHRLGIFGRWWPGGRFTIICFDFPADLKDKIKRKLQEEGSPAYFAAPLGLHTWLLEEIISLFDTSVWKCRDIVRAHEKQRSSVIRGSRNRAEQYYENLHELARHAVHVTEMLATALNVLDMVLEEQQSLEPGEQRLADKNAVDKTLRYLKSLLQGFRPRAQALEQRLTSETNLLFHLTNQDIATSAQEDSAVMRAISFLGLVFLPGTFISAIFSMSFFNYSPGDNAPWSVSSRFWIYWAVAIPVTLLTILFWQCASPLKVHAKRLRARRANSEGELELERNTGLVHRLNAKRMKSSSTDDLEMLTTCSDVPGGLPGAHNVLPEETRKTARTCD